MPSSLPSPIDDPLNPAGAGAAEGWVLYDGECGLCDRIVRFLLRHDARRRLRFAPLQGRTAARLRERHPEMPPLDETFVFVERPEREGEKVRFRSDAALAAVEQLGAAWRLVRPLWLIPRPLRDAIYSFIARRRTRWFGRLEACRIPTAVERARFLD